MIGRRSHDEAQSFEEAWSGGAPRDEHIADLVDFVEALCRSAVIQPDPDFCESLRTRLMTEAVTVLVPTPHLASPARTHTTKPHTIHKHGAQRPSLRSRMAGITIAAVASVGVVGLVASSASAMPGEMLYPVKRGVESVELALHRDDASRGSFQLKQASERLAEISEMGGTGPGPSSDLVAHTLDDFAQQAEAGSSALFADYSDSGSTKSVRIVNDFAATSTAGLSALSEDMPADATESFDSATKTINDLAIRASSLCSACASTDAQALVNAVKGLAKSTPARGKAPSGSTKDTDGSAKKEPVSTRPTAGSLTPILPTLPSVTDSPTTGEPATPDVGGLLGTGDHPGLVEGLVDGLSVTK